MLQSCKSGKPRKGHSGVAMSGVKLFVFKTNLYPSPHPKPRFPICSHPFILQAQHKARRYYWVTPAKYPHGSWPWDSTGITSNEIIPNPQGNSAAPPNTGWLLLRHTVLCTPTPKTLLDVKKMGREKSHNIIHKEGTTSYYFALRFLQTTRISNFLFH